MALGLALAPAAAGDGDPASDVLYTHTLFLPYEGVPPSVSAPLMRELAALRRARYPLSVALISSPADLGAVPQVFGQPQRYAAFLEREIDAGGRRPLLVVMPSGYGTAAIPAAGAAAVAGLPPSHGASGRALGRAALAAVGEIVASLRRPAGGGIPWLAVGLLAGLAAATGGLLLAARRTAGS